MPLARNSEPHTEGWFVSAVSNGASIRAVFGSSGLLSVQFLGFPEETSGQDSVGFTIDPSTGQFSRLEGIAHGDLGGQDLGTFLANKFRERVYGFRAVRFGIDEQPIGAGRDLAPDASNLVQVLHLLTSNPIRWRRFVKNVRTVLPERTSGARRDGGPDAMPVRLRRKS